MITDSAVGYRQLFSDLEVEPYQHLVGFFMIYDVKDQQPQQKMEQYGNVEQLQQLLAGGNYKGKKLATLSTFSQLQQQQQQSGDDLMDIQQQPIKSQVYLSKLAGFALDAPQKTYKGIIIGVLCGVLGLVVLFLISLPIRRRFEAKWDKRRQAAVKIEEVGMNPIPFEELDE